MIFTAPNALFYSANWIGITKNEPMGNVADRHRGGLAWGVHTGNSFSIMTFHEAASVFLIIGGVLLGPIEGREILVNVVQNEEWGKCMQNNNMPGKVYDLNTKEAWHKAAKICRFTVGFSGFRRETTAETCARVMRDIGAEKDAREVDGQHPEIYQYIEFGWYVEGQRVLCIPAPSGLVR